MTCGVSYSLDFLRPHFSGSSLTFFFCLFVFFSFLWISCHLVVISRGLIRFRFDCCFLGGGQNVTVTFEFKLLSLLGLSGIRRDSIWACFS